MQKKFYRERFSEPLSDLEKFQAPFLPRKLWVNPIEKHNSIFTGKFVILFFKTPLQGSKILRPPPFCIRSPQQVFVNDPLLNMLKAI